MRRGVYLATCAAVGAGCALIIGNGVAFLFAGLVGVCLEAVVYADD